MNPAWKPDTLLDIETAHKVIWRQFPEFADLAPAFLGQGWDNLCLEYPNGIVFRLPVRAVSAELVPREDLALTHIAGTLPLPTPEILYRGAPSEGFPCPFLGYPKLPGRTIGVAPSNPAMASELGGFLRSLHATPWRSTPLEALPDDWLKRTDLDQLRRTLAERGERLIEEDPGAEAEVRAALESASSLHEIAAPPGAKALVHGDFYAQQILVDDTGVPSAIIDWGDVHLGDPMADCSVCWTTLDPLDRSAFLEAYGADVPVGDLARAQLRACNYAFVLQLYGLGQSIPEMVDLGRLILSRFLS